jgi:hypothetical protein
MRNFVLALIAMVTLSSCAEKGPTLAEISLTGVYTVRTVNGNNLPVVLTGSGTTTIELVSSTLTLNANGSYTDMGTLRHTSAGVVTMGPNNDAGTYTFANGTIRFASTVNAGSILNGTPGTNTITIVSQGMTIVYRRL